MPFPSNIRHMLLTLLALFISTPVVADETALDSFIKRVHAAELVENATDFGRPRTDIPVASLFRDGVQVGWVFITSDFVSTTGYSGKPIHTMVAIDNDAKVIGVQLVKHSEPIVLIGIPDQRMKALVRDYRGLDLVAEAKSGGTAHELDIISGATVTIMVVDDSIVRAGLKVARHLGLGGLDPEKEDNGPRFELNPEATAPSDWMALEGNGTLRRLSLDVGQINAAFAAMGDERATRRALKQAPETTFIEMQAALVSHPSIADALLGEAEAENLGNWLEPGDHAIAILGRGLYSFKGSGYVRGGIFDRIVLIQDDVSVRFRDRMHKRIIQVRANGAPAFNEADLFKIPAESEFDPTRPFRIQLLVQREVGAIEKVFTTFELGYELPKYYQREIPIAPEEGLSAEISSAIDQSETDAHQELWKRIWDGKRLEIAVLVVMLTVLTGTFFFQTYVTRNEKKYYWFRIVFLTFTLFFLGWYANAQLSVVNLIALLNSLMSGFSWQAFLLDPLTFILWFAVAAALLFWGRGAYCGWLCPFGALQELLNQTARALHVPQWTLPWGLHERLWPIKYMIFLGIFGVSLVSVEHAERMAEVEPFKTAIVLKFIRTWPFVAYAAALLIAGLFVERFFCRYLCPLGGALAIPARLRMFDWLKRYRECGNPCRICATECPVQSIHPTGEINPNECINCMHCQMLYRSEDRCPVVVKMMKRRKKTSAAPDLDLLAKKRYSRANKPNETIGGTRNV